MRQHLYAASGVALVLALTPAAGHAADLVQTLKDQGQFSELVSAVEQAGLAETLQGEGPYTVFAPTDEAFGKLPEGAMSQLTGSNGQLADVLKHHVVEGQEVMAKDVLGQETQVSTLSGDQVTVDGTGTMMVLVPAGLQVTRVGDDIFVQREVGAMAAPAITVTTGSEGQQGQQQSQQDTGADQQSEQQATAGSDQGQQPMADAENPEAAAGRQLTQDQQSGQQRSQGQQQAGAGGQQAQQGDQGQPMDQQSGVLRAAMVVGPDIRADNGVIHAIDEVLVPQKIEQQLGAGQQGASGTEQGQSGSSN